MRHKLMICMLIVLNVSATALASSPKKGKAQTAVKPVEERLVSLDYKMGEIRAVFDDIARQTGSTLQVDSAIGGKISLTMKEIPVGKVMDMICQNFYCNWSVQKGTPPKLVITSRPAPKS